MKGELAVSGSEGKFQQAAGRFGGRAGGGRRTVLFALYPLAGLAAPLIALPAVTFTNGAAGLATVAVGQSIGGMGSVLVELGWGLDGPQRVAAAEDRDRRGIYWLAARQRFIAFVVVGLLALPVVLVLGSPGPLTTWLFALSALGGGLSTGWFAAGLHRPAVALFADSVPRLAATVISALLLVSGAALAVYGVLVALACCASPVLGALLLGYHRRRRTEESEAKSFRRRQSWVAVSARITSSLYLSLPAVLVSQVAPVHVVAAFAGQERVLRMGLTGLSFVPTSMQASLAVARGKMLNVAAARCLQVSCAVGLAAGITAFLILPITVKTLTSGLVEVSLAASFFGGVLVCATCVSRGIGSVLFVRVRHMDYLLASSLIGAVFGVPALVLGTTMSGASGALAALAATEVVVLAVQAILWRHVLKAEGERFEG